MSLSCMYFFFFKQKTAYEMRISDGVQTCALPIADIMVERCRQKELTRTRILDEAARAIREQGAGGIGVAPLMQRAGLTHGGFYAHFENREHQIAKTFARMHADSQQMLRRHTHTPSAADGVCRRTHESLDG